MYRIGLISGISLVLLAQGGRAADLPGPLLEKVQQLVPGATVTKIKVKDRAGQRMYKVDIRIGENRKGKIELSADGTLLKFKLDFDLAGLPKAVAQAAQELYPDADFDKAEQEVKDGRTSFKVKFRQGGLKLEAVFDAGGKLLERRDELNVQSLPQAIREVIARDHAGARITRARRRLRDGRDYFEVRVEIHFRLSLPHPTGTRTDIHRVRASALPPAVREAAQASLGDLSKLRFIKKTTAPVTVYEVEVRRSLNLEFGPDGQDLGKDRKRAGAKKGGNGQQTRPDAVARAPMSPVPVPVAAAESEDTF